MKHYLDTQADKLLPSEALEETVIRVSDKITVLPTCVYGMLHVRTSSTYVQLFLASPYSHRKNFQGFIIVMLLRQPNPHPLERDESPMQATGRPQNVVP